MAERGESCVSGVPTPTKFVKHRSGKPLTSGQKTIILNVFHKFSEKYPELPIKEIVNLTSEFTGVSCTSINGVRKEKTKTGKVITPGKKRKRSKPVTDTCDEFVKNAIRVIVHNFFFKNEPPTINKVLHQVNNDPELPNFKRTTFYKILCEIGFEFVKRSQKSVIMDRDDILLWRRDYLRAVRRFREQGRKLYYLDETWVNEGYTTNKVWTDTTVKTKKKAFLSGLSTGLKNPSGKGKRLILLHIGSEDGFVEGGELLFESKKTGDYHEDMNGDVFRDWFINIIPKLEPNSVVVMDNASYHSVKADRLPNRSWLRNDIIAWMEVKNIPFDKHMVKDELLRTIREANVSNRYDKFIVDSLAQDANITVQRLPPYHCMLNPIEMIWSQVKGYVRQRNTTFKLKEVKALTQEAIKHVTAFAWQKCIEHVVKEEALFWELDNLSDTLVDKLVINIGDESSSSSVEKSDTDMEGIEEIPESE